MTIYEFRSLDEAEQIEAFWEGILVGSYQKDSCSFECRQIDDFMLNINRMENTTLI